jgi:hypothetical protein
MRSKEIKKPESIVIANNDVVYLWWTYPEKIANCLGFSIHRIVDGIEESKGLMATVGFDVKTDIRKSPQTTDEWPIQSFNWKDLYAPHDKEIKYKIIPMIDTGKGFMVLSPDEINSIITDSVKRNDEYGPIKIIFNRGMLSTQAFSKGNNQTGEKTESDLDHAKELISTPGSEWRNRLAGQPLHNVKDFFRQEGKFYCALYELSDKELIDLLLVQQDAEIILSSSDSNDESRPALHKAMDEGKLKIYDRFMPQNSIGHNKFVVNVDKNGNPKSVWTGSMNWTPTGLCGQTNNVVIINDPLVAEWYLKYWDALRNDTDSNGNAMQGSIFRKWCRENSPICPVNSDTTVKLWYSPNTLKKTKPAKITFDAVPVDMNEIFNLIDKAEKQIMYLVFNPGTPSIIDSIQKKARQSKEANNPVFVRGAISDATTAGNVTTNIISKDATLPPDKYQVTGVAAIPGKFSYWEKEMLKIGFATIHDKILVIDPFDPEKCAVVTGSHNLGFKASYSNDENLLIIKGNAAIAKAYATHVLDVVNHFKWRYRLQNKVGKKTGEEAKKALENSWNDLSETDNWMNYYYDQNGDLDREQLLFK